MARLLQALEESLFADKLLEDPREPLTTFTIPGFDGTFGLYAPTLALWQQLLYVSSKRHASMGSCVTR
jgi:hypothetical protein